MKEKKRFKRVKNSFSFIIQFFSFGGRNYGKSQEIVDEPSSSLIFVSDFLISDF